jgi:hypothetical protein
MVTLQGLALIAELAAAMLLIVALAGFGLSRSKPWLMGSAVSSWPSRCSSSRRHNRVVVSGRAVVRDAVDADYPVGIISRLSQQP